MTRMRDWHGIVTPLVTPLHDDETPDLESMARLVEFQLRAGVHGFWVMGTTGEFAAFTEDERAAVVETVVRATHGRVPVLANASDAGTRLTIRHAQRALIAGADAVAATPPYYYPHAQSELIDHYRSIAAAVALPLYVYNIPQTVRVRVELPTVMSLAREGVVAGIKDSQNDLDWLRRLILATTGTDFTVFAGTWSLIDAAVLLGAAGAIPSIANTSPDVTVALYDRAVAGNWNEAADLEAGFIDTDESVRSTAAGSPNGAVISFLKTLLWKRGIIASPAVTAPLRPASSYLDSGYDREAGRYHEVRGRIG